MKDPQSRSSPGRLAAIIGGSLFIVALVVAAVALTVVKSGQDEDRRADAEQRQTDRDSDAADDEGADADDEASTDAEAGADEAPAAPDAGGETRTIKGGTAKRWLSITIPTSISALGSDTVLVDGATGRAADEVDGSGGFIASVFTIDPAKRCPAKWDTLGDDLEPTGTLASLNVFVAGPFRSVGKAGISEAGQQRVCGYMTRADGEMTGHRLIDEVIDVAESGQGAGYEPVQTPTGTYVAEAADTVGGASSASVTLILTGDPEEPKIARLQVKGVKISTCMRSPGDERIGTVVRADVSKPTSTPNKLIGDGITAYFKMGGQYQEATLSGGSDGEGILRGTVVVPTSDGICRGSLAFTAKLRR